MLDRIKSAALSGYIKKKYYSYFANEDFSAQLNSQEGSLKFAFTLAGEDSQTIVAIEKFEIVPFEEGSKALVAKKISSNRLWIQKIAEDFLLEKPMKLPSIVAGAL